jgi:hypothetical protein
MHDRTATISGSRGLPEAPSNVTLSVVPPFFAVPSWWRRFLFWTLRPREVTVYLYVLSLLDKTGIAFPTQEQMAYELNLAGTEPISQALTILERNGFLMRRRSRLAGRQTSSARTIYWRPATEFTLVTLLDREKIDGRLYPASKTAEQVRDELDTTESAVALGLRNLLGADRYAAYIAEGASVASLREQLIGKLEERTRGGSLNAILPNYSDEIAELYKSWVESVFRNIYEKIGGDREQTGSLRKFQNGRFGLSMDYKAPYGEGDKGVVQSSVAVDDIETRRWPEVVKFPWRTVTPADVAKSMLERYYKLGGF